MQEGIRFKVTFTNIVDYFIKTAAAVIVEKVIVAKMELMMKNSFIDSSLYFQLLLRAFLRFVKNK